MWRIYKMNWKGYLKILINIEKDGEIYFPKDKDRTRKLKETIKNKDKFIEFYKKMVFGGASKESFYELLKKEKEEKIENEIYFHPEIPREVYEKQANKKMEDIKKDYEELLKQDWNKIKENL